MLNTNDCMPERKSQETKDGLKGAVMRVADEFILISSDENDRYLVCNLPDLYKKEGTKVTYSLVTKEIYPNERWIATPAYLIEIAYQ